MAPIKEPPTNIIKKHHHVYKLKKLKKLIHLLKDLEQTQTIKVEKYYNHPNYKSSINPTTTLQAPYQYSLTIFGRLFDSSTKIFLSGYECLRTSNILINQYNNTQTLICSVPPEIESYSTSQITFYNDYIIGFNFFPYGITNPTLKVFIDDLELTDTIFGLTSIDGVDSFSFIASGLGSLKKLH
ncbi:hypothetical protein ACTFIZ_008388 [Dictyostelium cf. discoideum]